MSPSSVGESGRPPEAEELLVVSSWAPPTIGGTPTVLRNLLEALCDRHRVRVEIVRQLVRPEEADAPARWPTTTLVRPAPLANVKGGHYALAPAVFAIVLRRTLSRRKLRVLVTLPEESFALASALACRIARRPYALYMHNTYAEQAVHPLDKLLARFAERWLIRGASPLLVLSDALRELYRSKYSVDGAIVPHVVEAEPFRSVSADDLPRGVNPDAYALFTGDVYGMNRDSLQRLGRVLRERFRDRLSFVVSGQKTRAELAELGLDPDVVLTGVDRRALLALQKHAALLLAPLAFDSPFPGDVRTALPTKVIEYLVAGPPILVHAPPGSLLAARAEAEGWATVVSSQSKEELTAAVGRLLDDESFRRALGEQALAASRAHAPAAVAAAFLSAMRNGSAT